MSAQGWLLILLLILVYELYKDFRKAKFLFPESEEARGMYIRELRAQFFWGVGLFLVLLVASYVWDW